MIRPQLPCLDPRSPHPRRAACTGRSRLSAALGSVVVPWALLSSVSSAQDLLDTFSGSFDGDQWGSAVAAVGDVDGDGVRDIAVGSPKADFHVFFPVPHTYTDVGVVRVYSGSTGAVLHTWAGDLGGGTEFGYSLCDASDVNADGFDDVLVGIPMSTGTVLRNGSVQLRSGANGSVLRTFQGNQYEARFGHAIAAGRIDGDAVYDVAIGSPNYDLDDAFGGPFQEGLVRVYRCSDGALILSDPGDETGFGLGHCTRGGWGFSLAYAGDFDGDGLGAIVVGAPTSSYQLILLGVSVYDAATGYVQVYEPLLGEAGAHKSKGQAGQLMGSAVCALGDANGNGEVDIAVGFPGDVVGGSTVGSVRVFDFGSSGFSIFGTSAKPLGFDAASAGDVTGDGLPDLLVGSPLADVLGFPTTKSDAGRVELYSGADGSFVQSFLGDAAGDRLGDAMAGGDLDGDGVAEVVLAAPRANGAGVDRGVVSVYDFAEDCGTPAMWSVYGQGTAGTLGVPSLAGIGLPTLGSTFDVSIGNSLGQPTAAYLLLGFFAANIPAHGGIVLVDSLATLPFPLPGNGITFPLVIPDDPTLCGWVLITQVIEVDPGAVLGASFTQALRMSLGH